MLSIRPRIIFSESPDPEDDFKYPFYGEKIQLNVFKRILSKKHVILRSGLISGGGIYGMSPERPKRLAFFLLNETDLLHQLKWPFFGQNSAMTIFTSKRTFIHH